MATTPEQTPAKLPEQRQRQPLFFRDLASPAPSSGPRRFTTPGQAAAVSALRRNNLSPSPPPPPLLSLHDLPDLSPEPLSPALPTPDSLTTPISSRNYRFSASPSPIKSSSRAEVFGQYGTALSFSPEKSRGERGQGSPVEGVVVQSAALITLPPPREVARPEVRKDCSPVWELDEEVWVTVYGFASGDTNLVLREFEKCGVVLRTVPGPNNANWMHILYQSRYDAQKALAKHGQQLNGLLIIGVKQVDPLQRRYLNESLDDRSTPIASPFPTLPPPTTSGGANIAMGIPVASAVPYPSQNKSELDGSSGAIASPAKSVLSKVFDLMFGI